MKRALQKLGINMSLKSMTRVALAVVAVAGCVSFATQAYSTTFDFVYTDAIATASTPGIAVGDTFTANLFLNNGGSTVASQSWTASQTSGFTITAGSYFATYSLVWQSDFSFTTDASGNVSFVRFWGTDYGSHNTDRFGTWNGDTVFGDASFVDSQGLSNTIAAATFNNVGQWTLGAPVATPIPGALLLFGPGLAGFAVVRRRFRK